MLAVTDSRKILSKIGGRQMTNDIDHCINMIQREEQRIAAAPSREAAEMHQQMIMLYRAQLEHLRRAKTRTHH